MEQVGTRAQEVSGKSTGPWLEMPSISLQQLTTIYPALIVSQNDCTATGKIHFKHPGPFRQATHEQSELKWYYSFPLQEPQMGPGMGFPLLECPCTSSPNRKCRTVVADLG